MREEIYEVKESVELKVTPRSWTVRAVSTS